jgi:hypothetical protein
MKNKKIIIIDDNESDKSESDDGFAELNILKSELVVAELRTKDCHKHHYHQKNNCIYSKSIKNKKWRKHKGST